MCVSELEQHCQPPVVYRGPDAVKQFLDYLLGKEQIIQQLLDQEAPMIITPEEEAQFQNASHCLICQEELGADRVRNHFHLSRKNCGPAHNQYNLTPVQIQQRT